MTASDNSMDPTSTDDSLVIPFALELLVVMMMWTDGASGKMYQIDVARIALVIYTVRAVEY